LSTPRLWAMESEVSFRQLFCRAVGCGVMFFVCRPCYRGQAYCSEECRQGCRRQQRQKANRRYQQDPEVRRDHRDRMREYRKQLREVRVTDQSSMIDCGSGSICEPLVKAVPETPPAEKLHDQPKATWRERFSRIICIICGRGGRFVAARIRRE
jgi:hypothetical protein